MGNKNSEFDKVFFRLRELGINTQRELAKKLGITPGGVNSAKRRGVFPKNWAVKLSKLLGESIDWILGMERHKEENNKDKDEVIRLQKKVINTLEKDNASLKEENRILHEGRLNTPVTKKVGKNYLNQRKAAKAEKEEAVNY